jgi:phage tail-like protein
VQFGRNGIHTISAQAQNSFTSALFLIQIQGVSATAVTELAGIEVDVAVLTSREGTDLTSGQKQPGQASYTNLVVRRPLTKDLALWNWMQQSVGGTASPAAISVRLLDAQEQPVVIWTFKNAFPVKWTGPVFNALSNDIAIETLEIAHSGFTIAAAT